MLAAARLPILGMLWGMLSASPLVFALFRSKHNDASTGLGLVGVVVSFGLIVAAIFVVHLRRPTQLVSFGLATSLSFLALVLVSALIVLKD